MPIYEYSCSACDHAFEYLARTFSDRPEKCPACGAKKLNKRLSTFAPAVAAPKQCGGCANAPVCPSARTGGCGCGCTAS
ncbi:MAG: zinc ribbon domain-containing protein [Kiritimatiellae bacterium]|nr:zinc ribbon domain-containing protein [Kiritimatiellia bacterium]